ncbi:HAMP domain-containing sensor histidine kinase [Phenylobacterium sp.]|uniref:sensor histidine kinase n=1 Tax=Phenylobacterium sp. TaxID=1871053 RepID=UPI002810C9FA|nr:HAMP domain-containing sensor histidine kinase [Phenylobacterium sp.]
MDAAYRDLILVHEARTELKGSIAAWFVLASVTAFLAFLFAGKADPIRFTLWLGTIATLLLAWLAAWITFVRRTPTDEAILTRWIPSAKVGMVVCNLATAGSVWVFLPVSDPELRALLFVLFAWYLIIQFAAATEATQVLNSAVISVLGSLTAWLLIARPPYFAPLALMLPMFGATLMAIRRFIRQAVVASRMAQAAADQARDELAAALVDLERERDAKTQFIRAASHDLQQPLQAASLFLDRVKPGARAAEQAAAVGGLRRALTAARTLVASMLDHLKLEGGVVVADMASFPAAELFERVLLTQGPAAAEAGMRISVAGRSVELHADGLLLARAVENLVANAIRHSGGRRIVMGARAQGEWTFIWVVDDGQGLSPGDEARVFAPFAQGARVGSEGGFGLGLAATRNLVELMHGDCGVRPGVTRGAAFWIALPAAAHALSVRCAA